MTAPHGYPPAQYPQQPAYPPGPQFQQPYPPGPQFQQPYPPGPQFQQPYPPAQPQQFAPQFPTQQGYPQPQLAQPAAPLAQGSLDDFFNQPATGGGKSLAFEQVGARHIGIVTRPLGQGDVQQQTAQGTNAPLFFKDGRPKFVMKVPLQMQPSQAYPDGLATWFVKGQARDELVRAMAEAGAPAGPPESGAIIDITHTNTRPSGAGMNPAKLFQIAYRRPDGAGGAPPQQPSVQAQAPGGIDFSAPQYQQPTQQPQPPAQPQQPTQQPQPPAQPQLPTQQPQPPAQPPQAMPSAMTPEQQTLLAKLTRG